MQSLSVPGEGLKAINTQMHTDSPCLNVMSVFVFQAAWDFFYFIYVVATL